MSKSTKKTQAQTNDKKPFTPTFKKLDAMTEGERNAFYQGCKTNENKTKRHLGMLPPLEK